MLSNSPKQALYYSSVMALTVLAAMLQSPPGHAQQKAPARMLDSFTVGFFYTSRSIGDGVNKLSECDPVSTKSFAQFKPPFTCSPDGKGFRCTNGGSRVVVFVFSKHPDCVADLKQMLDSDPD